MSQHYSDPSRASDPHALPDVETFYMTDGERAEWADGMVADEGWYWWHCFPGCLPDSEPVGPFNTEADALADAQLTSEE